MYSNNAAQTIGRRIADSVRTNGSHMTVVAKAADMRPAQFEQALLGEEPFTFEQLVAVGGFLSLPVPSLFEGVTP